MTDARRRRVGSAIGRQVGAPPSKAHREKVERTVKTIFKSEIDYAIWQAVLGRPSPWLLDREAKGSFKDRSVAGDRQILLWAIFKSWLENLEIPGWAGLKLYEILFHMAKGGFLKKEVESPTWNEAFGKPYADDKRAGGMKTRSRMFEVYQEVRKIVSEKKKKKEKIDYDEMFHKVGQRFGLSGATVKNLHGDVKQALERGYQPLNPLIDYRQR